MAGISATLKNGAVLLIPMKFDEIAVGQDAAVSGNSDAHRRRRCRLM